MKDWNSIVESQAKQYTSIIQGKCTNNDADIDAPETTTVKVDIDAGLYQALTGLLKYYNIPELTFFEDVIGRGVVMLSDNKYVYELLNKTPASTDSVGIKAIRK